jgi:hypothetical protein
VKQPHLEETNFANFRKVLIDNKEADDEIGAVLIGDHTRRQSRVRIGAHPRHSKRED